VSDRPVPIRTDAHVVSNESAGGANLRLVLRVPGFSGFEPGQFVMLSPGARTGVDRSDPLLPRPMAIYRARGDEIEVLYKVVGRGTGLLSQVRSGERVRVVGPLGLGFREPGPGERAVVVAGGTGVASVYELAARLAGRFDVVVLLGARTRDDLMGRDDFAALDVRLEIATEDGSEGIEGLVTALLESELGAGGPARVYACGPTAMMRAAAERAASRGAACVVSLENTMACGFGVCLGCAAPLSDGGSALVCRDGPVFDANILRWDALA